MMLICVLSLFLNVATVLMLLTSLARQRAAEDELLAIKNILHRKRAAMTPGQTVSPFRSRIEGSDAG